MPAKLLTSGGGGVILQPASSIASDVTVNVPSRDCTLRTTGESVITSGTAVASTSGTSIDFTSIPSWVKRITLIFRGVSTTSTANYMVQIGSGSVVTSGYICNISVITSSFTGNVNSYTNGFHIYNTGAASDAASGHVVLTPVSGNTWVYSSNILSTGSRASQAAGNVALSGVLDIVRVTTSTGIDTFDAGSINILYE